MESNKVAWKVLTTAAKKAVLRAAVMAVGRVYWTVEWLASHWAVR